ncbi:hypothetical protein C8J56DRAFT_896497 [Mycena floridula]|nr:hypothetical protein C8J56DRAFT_896497 [Mycena floridula]
MFQHVHRVLACQYPDTPPLLKSMLHTAKLYGIDFIDIKLSWEVQGQMSTWSHPGEKKGERNRNNTSIALCLRNNHGVQKVEDLLKIQLRLTLSIMTIGQKICAIEAQTRLNQLLPKWNPLVNEADPGSCLQRQTIWDLGLNRETNPKSQKNPHSKTFIDPDEGRCPISVWVAGACTNKGYNNAISGGGLWFTASSQWNQSICLPKLVAQTTQNGVLYSILWAIETVPAHTKLLFETENQHASQQLCKKLELWENTGFVGLDNRKILEAIATRL